MEGIIMFILTMMVLLGFTMLFLAKHEVTIDCRLIIISAIGAYLRDQIDNDNFDAVNLVDFDDMESYNDTLIRFWDWGYARILPKDKYELIKPYIEEGKRKTSSENLV